MIDRAIYTDAIASKKLGMALRNNFKVDRVSFFAPSKYLSLTCSPSGVTKVQPITISAEQETVSSVSGSSSRVSSARSLVSSMWAGSEEPDYDAFAKARRVNLYGQVS